MRISGTDLAQSIQSTQQISNASQSQLARATIVSDSNDNGIKTSISDDGKRMGQMMNQAGRMNSPQMRSQMTEMKSSIEELELDELDLDTMTDEEISAVASQINDVMESYKPADVESAVNLESMTSEQKLSFVSDFKENTDTVLSSMGKMEGMMEGPPPGGGKPPVGGKTQNAIEAYESQMSVDEDDEELSLIESLMEALEADEAEDDLTDEAADVSNFYQVIGDYLSKNM